MATYVQRPTVPPGVYATSQRSATNIGEFDDRQGAHLDRGIRRILEHWATLDLAPSQSWADWQYEPMPPIRTHSIHVSLRIRGRGVPMPYELDDLLE